MFLKQIKKTPGFSVFDYRIWCDGHEAIIQFFLFSFEWLTDFSIYCLCMCFESQGETSLQCLISVNNVEAIAWTGKILPV